MVVAASYARPSRKLIHIVLSLLALFLSASIVLEQLIIGNNNNKSCADPSLSLSPSPMSLPTADIIDPTGWLTD